MVDINQTVNMKLNSIKLSILGMAIIAPVFIIATFWQALGFGSEETIFLALALIAAFGFNITGLIFGIKERKKDHKKALIGILANSALVVLFFIVLISSFFSLI